MHLFHLLILFFFILTGCQRNILYLYQQKVDAKYLASTNVGSPDPLTPPQGQMIVAEWWLPSAALEHSPYLRMHVLFRNYTQDWVEYPIYSRIGSKTYWIVNEDFKKTKGPLAYKAEIITQDGESLAQWEHQLWVRLIEIEDTEEIKSSVSE